MSKTVQSVKNSLKFKAAPKAGLMSVRVGVKKYSIPVEARMLSNGGFLFLSFSASSELYKIENGDLVAMPATGDAAEAFAALNPGRKRRKARNAASVELPSNLADILSSLPEGMRLGYGPDGKPRLVRTRVRRKKKA